MSDAWVSREEKRLSAMLNVKHFMIFSGRFFCLFGKMLQGDGVSLMVKLGRGIRDVLVQSRRRRRAPGSRPPNGKEKKMMLMITVRSDQGRALIFRIKIVFSFWEIMFFFLFPFRRSSAGTSSPRTPPSPSTARAGRSGSTPTWNTTAWRGRIRKKNMI